MRKIKVGHIGWLSRDEGTDCTTVAWCDVNEEKMKRLKLQHPEITMYTDYREMVRHPGLDAVVISTPNWLHCDMACAFLEAGVHVFIEKPMGINRAEMDRLVVAARKNGKNLTVDFEMRVSPFALRIKQLLDSGELGELRRIEMIHHRGSWLEEGNGIWRTRAEKSGGLFLMEPIHSIDIFRFFAGDIKAVQATSGPNVLANYQFPDNVCAHFFFQNGVMATILSSHTLSAVTKDPDNWSKLGHDMNMIFTCTKGTIAVDFLGARSLINRYEEYPKGAKGTRVVFDRVEDRSASENWHSYFHDIGLMRLEFIRRCANGEPPLQDPADAWKTHLVCLAAEESAKTDFRRIELDYTLPKLA